MASAKGAFCRAAHPPWQATLQIRLPRISQQGIAVVVLLPPRAFFSIKSWRSGASEEGRGADYFMQLKHPVCAHKLEEVVDATDMDVVENEERSLIQMRV